MKKTETELIYTGAVERIPFIFTNKKGIDRIQNLQTQVAAPALPNNNFDYSGCGDEINDNYVFTYTGASIQATCNTSVHDVITTWTVVVPENVSLSTNSLTKGRWRLSTFDPYQTVPLSITNISSAYMNPATGNFVKKYTLSFYFTINDPYYCNATYIYVNCYKLVSDCSETPLLSSAAITDPLDPATYKVIQYAGQNYPATVGIHKMEVNPLYLACSGCHNPTLGTSPEHKYSYRLIGATTWSEVTITTALSTIITLPIGGNYEYRSRGKLKTDGTYSDYSPTYICTID